MKDWAVGGRSRHGAQLRCLALKSTLFTGIFKDGCKSSFTGQHGGIASRTLAVGRRSRST